MPRSAKKSKEVKIIKKANQLIEARYRFDIWETRIFLSVLACIRTDDTDFAAYRVWYKDIIRIFGLRSHQSYDLLREAAKSLMSRTFHVNYQDNGFLRERAYHIIRSADYLQAGQSGQGIEGQEYIDVTIDPEMKPLLLQLKGNFTAYDLRNVAKLGAQPIRLYELLKQYEVTGERRLDIEYLRRVLEFDEEYPLFADFYRYFIGPAVREINKYTDLIVHHEQKIREKRRVVAIHFHFRRKTAEEMAHVHGQATPPPIVMPPEFPFPNAQKQPIAPYEAFSARLQEWWGVHPEELAKRAQGRSEREIEAAIAFTQTRIRAGKAENPAGVFLEALTKTHRTHAQHQALRKQQRAARTEQLQLLLGQYQAQSDAYAKAINDAIRRLTQADSTLTEQVIAGIKAAYQAAGDRSLTGKTVEDFRENPMLRGLVKAEIMRQHPANFHALHAQYRAELETLEREIKQLDPTHQILER